MTKFYTLVISAKVTLKLKFSNRFEIFFRRWIRVRPSRIRLSHVKLINRLFNRVVFFSALLPFLLCAPCEFQWGLINFFQLANIIRLPWWVKNAISFILLVTSC